MLYVFTGNGKGKTSAALGMGLRAAGAGRKVLMVQFLKTGESSENLALRHIPNFKVRAFGRKGFFLPRAVLEKRPELKQKGIMPLSEQDFQLANEGFNFAKEAAQSKACDFLILDEINIALYYGLIKQEDCLKFLRRGKEKLELILTGRYASRQIVSMADLVTECREIKHYYQIGKMAKKVLEF